MDLYRVAAVALVVAGHWLAASVAFHDGHFVRENPLAELPWTQWLTWIFQTVPVLFLVAGYASAASWTRRTDARFGNWLRRRFRAVLGPTTTYVLVVLAGVGVAVLARVDASSVALSAWSVAMHLWFIPMYLVLVALTPAAIAMHRRWGLLPPLALSIAVGVVDAVRLGGGCPLSAGPTTCCAGWRCTKRVSRGSSEHCGAAARSGWQQRPVPSWRRRSASVPIR